VSVLYNIQRWRELFNLFGFPSSSHGRNATTCRFSGNSLRWDKLKVKINWKKAAVEMRYTLTDQFRLYCRTWPFAVKNEIFSEHNTLYTLIYLYNMYIMYCIICNNIMYSLRNNNRVIPIPFIENEISSKVRAFSE